MTLEVESIKTAYEVLGLTPELIAEERNVDIVSVKAALMSSSSKYRKDMGIKDSDGNASELDFSDDELKEANEIIVNTAKYAVTSDGSPDYKTRLAAATYIRDDKKGRKIPVKLLNGGNTFNIVQFNEALKANREMKQAMLNGAVNV